MEQADGCKPARFILEARSSHALAVTFPSDKCASRKAVIMCPEIYLDDNSIGAAFVPVYRVRNNIVTKADFKIKK